MFILGLYRYLMNQSAYPLAHNELKEVLAVLNLAINNHRIWSDTLHTSIICKQPFPSDILHAQAHTQCEFGQWYYGESSDAMKSFKEFWALESVHQFMHDNARDLANLVNQNEPIPIGIYQKFLSNQHQLIDFLTQFRDILIEHQDCFDALTGAINRKSISLLIDRSFENMRRYSQSYSIAMVDIDNFKSVNDQYGHPVGDQVLKYISTFLKKNIRNSDSVGRYGGEEFLILLPETKLEIAVKVMENIRKNLMNSGFMMDGTSLQVTFSAGVAQVVEEDKDAKTVINRADIALYLAKNSGRNRVIKAD